MATIIRKRKLSIAEAKDIENFIAQAEGTAAVMDYIVACDYPEVLEMLEAEVTDGESSL